MVGYGFKKMLEITAANKKIHIYFQINFELDSLCLKQVSCVNLAFYKNCCICTSLLLFFPPRAFGNSHVNSLGIACLRLHLDSPSLVVVLKEMLRRLNDHLAFFLVLVQL